MGFFLNNANLSGAHLEGAVLLGAYLEGTNFYDAHLEGAVLLGAHLRRANFRDAHLEGASLVHAIGLTYEQLCEAYGDGKTRLPEIITRPEHWPPLDRPT